MLARAVAPLRPVARHHQRQLEVSRFLACPRVTTTARCSHRSIEHAAGRSGLRRAALPSRCELAVARPVRVIYAGRRPELVAASRVRGGLVCCTFVQHLFSVGAPSGIMSIFGPGAGYSMHDYGLLIILAIIVLSIFIAGRAIRSFVSLAWFLIPAIRNGWKRVRYGRVSRQGASGRQFEPEAGGDPHSWPSSQ